ncbi:hypothetical protein ON010_g15905 [Phytophthora cinnamomi]|nr:hypothetical protein ON010_g15905 [Phytophthora cinnamomi]
MSSLHPPIAVAACQRRHAPHAGRVFRSVTSLGSAPHVLMLPLPRKTPQRAFRFGRRAFSANRGELALTGSFLQRSVGRHRSANGSAPDRAKLNVVGTSRQLPAAAFASSPSCFARGGGNLEARSSRNQFSRAATTAAGAPSLQPSPRFLLPSCRFRHTPPYRYGHANQAHGARAVRRRRQGGQGRGGRAPVRGAAGRGGGQEAPARGREREAARLHPQHGAAERQRGPAPRARAAAADAGLVPDQDRPDARDLAALGQGGGQVRRIERRRPAVRRVQAADRDRHPRHAGALASIQHVLVRGENVEMTDSEPGRHAQGQEPQQRARHPGAADAEPDGLFLGPAHH